MNRIAGILILLISLGVGWLWLDFKQFLAEPLDLPEKGLNYTVNPGTSLRSLAEDLQAKGTLSNSLYLRLFARWKDEAHRIQAGEYRIEPGTTPEGLLALLVSGKVAQHSLTLVEGWNFKQVLSAVRRDEALRQTLEGLTPDVIMDRLGHPGEHPEGRFFPDTYHFPRGMTDLEFLKRAYRSMEQTLAGEWARRSEGLPLKSPYEALILASIVEKETGLASERPEIAGVFIRRLRKGMKLQTDPTVIYGLGERYKGNLRRKHLAEDTPYNTYVHFGLTPTPISMPGGDAIRSVLHPAEGKSLYFVARGDGSHQFSATLQEHNNAVRKYQLGR